MRTRRIGETVAAEVCEDCYLAMHGFPIDAEAHPEHERHAMGDQLEGEDWTIGATDAYGAQVLGVSEAEAERIREDDPDTWTEAVETITFSWSPCHGCGCSLGGSRHVVTVWLDA